MKFRFAKTVSAALMVLGTGIGAAFAADAPPPYGAPLTIEQAKKMMAAAEAVARKNNWGEAVVIVDSTGDVLLAQKLDGTQRASMEIARGKAMTALDFRRPTKGFQDGMAPGGDGLRFLAVPGLTPLEGGVPVIVDGKVVGGIGASGAAPSQDTEVVTAALGALAPK